MLDQAESPVNSKEAYGNKTHRSTNEVAGRKFCSKLAFSIRKGSGPIKASPPPHPCLCRSNQGRRHAAWSHAKIRYLCLQSGTPQTHTTGSGHESSRLAYLTVYFH